MIEVDRQLVRERLERRDDAELLAIWTQNNQQEWTPLAFAVIQEILRERLIEIPPQAPPQIALARKSQPWRLALIGLCAVYAIFWTVAVVLRLPGLYAVLPIFYLWGWLDVCAGLVLYRQGLKRWQMLMTTMAVMGGLLFISAIRLTDLPLIWLILFLLVSQGLHAAVFWQSRLFQDQRASSSH